MSELFNLLEERLQAALDDLNARISAGEEYPDAEWRVSQKFGVRPEALRAMYDAS